jgi:tRNA-2-methylthio-N6-dimethylallyladenosine synthase
VKRRRNHDLLAVQQAVSAAENAAFVGRAVEVLVVGPSKRAAKTDSDAAGQLVGRTRSDHVVVFDGPPTLAATLATVRITSATAATLTGSVIKERTARAAIPTDPLV